MLAFLIFQIVFFVTLLAVLIGSIYTFWLTLKHPPYVPTVNPKVITSLVSYINDTSGIEYFIEPGSGFCGISLGIEKKFPQIQVICLEYNVFIWFLARIKLRLLGSKIKLYLGDFTTFDLSKYQQKNKTIIYCYLLPQLMESAYKNNQFRDSTVLTLDFQIPNVVASDNIQIGTSGFQKQLWIYTPKSLNQ
jgi:hypothetical protein